MESIQERHLVFNTEHAGTAKLHDTLDWTAHSFAHLQAVLLVPNNFLAGNICYRPLLWSSGQSSWLLT
jgi:hypothetical protein